MSLICDCACHTEKSRQLQDAIINDKLDSVISKTEKILEILKKENEEDIMDVEEYKQKVIELFKSGKATDAQWQELATIILFTSENDYEATENIDEQILNHYEIERVG